MTEVSNMLPEILEAVEDKFASYSDVLVDCLVFLNNSLNGKESNTIRDKLYKMNKCPYCGGDLSRIITKEVHTELTECPIEYFEEPYCPNCEV